MAYFFGDSFDLYTAGADMVGHWDATSVNPNSSGFAAGRFSGSRASNPSSATRYHKVSGANDSVHHFVFAIMCSNITGSTLGAMFQLDDGTTAQCCVVFRTDGTLLFTSGGPTGAVLATLSGAMTLSNVWYAFEVEIVVHNTNGSIKVRRNGSLTDDLFVGGLDTALTANNYANRMQFGSQSAANFYVDDLLWRSDAAAVAWVGDIRCYTRYPLADVSTQFSRTAAPTSNVLNGSFFSGSHPANTGYYGRFSPISSGRVTGASVSCNFSGGGGTGHFKMALFSTGAGGSIGTVLATSDEITNPGVAIISVTFPIPARVEKGQSYWLGINQDVAMTYGVGSTSNNGVVLAGAYSSWPTPNPGGTIASPNLPGALTAIVTPSLNADVVNELQQDASTNYVFSSTNGQADFYTINPISNIPVSILGVTTRGYMTKSDAGTRNATVQLKSASTTVQAAGTTFSPGVWTWVGRVDQVDPATSLPWTAAGVNNVNIGPIVTA